jgi:hypothetical protein
MQAPVRWALIGLSLLGAITLAGAALIPVQVDNREQVFEIPNGTWARRQAGAHLDILPQRMQLALGLRDVLVLRNRDDVPQIFGPTLIMPGQTFRLPFSVVGEFQFACTAHVSGQMTVAVEQGISAPWPRLRYRLTNLSTLVSQF